MKNLKTTLVSMAALSAAAFTSFAQEQAQPAAAAPEASAVQPASNAVSTTVNTKFGKLKITTVKGADSDVISVVTPNLPAKVNEVELVNTLVAVIMSITDDIKHQDALKAFAASVSTLSLGDMGGKSVSLNATFPKAGNPNLELLVGKAVVEFAPEITTAGEVKGDVVVTDERGAKTSTAVDVKSTPAGVSGTVGGSNVTASTPSVSQPEAAPVSVPDAQEAISTTNDSVNDTVGDGKGISPEA